MWRRGPRAGVPVLGLCLGAQMLAAACGGTAYRAPLPEAGVVAVSLTDAGAKDPLLAPLLPAFAPPGDATKKCFRSHHGDTFTLPSTAVLLATSASYQQVALCMWLEHGV